MKKMLKWLKRHNSQRGKIMLDFLHCPKEGKLPENEVETWQVIFSDTHKIENDFGFRVLTERLLCPHFERDLYRTYILDTNFNIYNQTIFTNFDDARLQHKKNIIELRAGVLCF